MKAILHNRLLLDLKGQDKSILSRFTYHIGKDVILNYEMIGDIAAVPREGIYKIRNTIQLEVEDKRKQHKELNLHFHGTLRDTQQEIADMIFRGGMKSCLVQAKCGWGKTFLGTYITATHNKPTLIVCHTKLLANQWHTELTNLLKTDIGFIGDGKDMVLPVTVGMYQSLIKRLHKLKDKFDLIIVDEAHRCPARVFSTVLNGISSRYQVGLSATPTRKDGLHITLSDFFGPSLFVARDADNILIPSVEIIKTDVPFMIRDPKRDWAKAITKLGNNDTYLRLIAQEVNKKIAHGRCVLIIADRLEALRTLQEMIPSSALVIGETKNRDEILDNVGKTYKAILSTTIFDEGVSCHRLDTIAFITPSNNAGKLEQRVGRIQREHPDKKDPIIMDFWLKGQIVSLQQRNRLKWYTQQGFVINE